MTDQIQAEHGVCEKCGRTIKIGNDGRWRHVAITFDCANPKPAPQVQVHRDGECQRCWLPFGHQGPCQFGDYTNALRVIEVGEAPETPPPTDELTDEYVRQELEKCGEPTCYICRLSRDLLKTRAALTTAKEERRHISKLRRELHQEFMAAREEAHTLYTQWQAMSLTVERMRGERDRLQSDLIDRNNHIKLWDRHKEALEARLLQAETGFESEARRAEELEEERDRAKAANERDRTALNRIVRQIDEEITGRMWLIDGRGAYEWDDDRYRQEFGWAVNALQEKLEPLRKIAGDLSNCPTTQAAVDAAKGATK